MVELVVHGEVWSTCQGPALVDPGNLKGRRCGEEKLIDLEV